MDHNLSIPLEVSAIVSHESEPTVSAVVSHVSEPTIFIALRIFSMVLMAITFVLGIVGNGLVIWVAGFRMRRTVTTICYLNLALADFSFLITIPFFITSFALRGRWIFGLFLCKSVYIITDINLFGSVFLITFIALDRCICVLHPVWSQNYRTVKLAMKLLVGPWTLAFFLTVPVMIFVTTVTDLDGNSLCLFNFAIFETEPTREKIIDLFTNNLIIRGSILFILGFSLPMFTVAICYGLIAAKVYRTDSIRSNRPLRLLSAVVASFFICWFPFQLVALLNNIWARKVVTGEISQILQLLVLPTSALAFFNSCLNPIVYVFVGRDFRENLLYSLPSNLEKALTEDPGPNPQSKTKSELQAM